MFALDDLHVLRRYRSGADASPEVHLLRHVVAHGFPAPAVLQASGPDLVMERLHGPTLLQALGAGEVSLPDAAGILHDLHTRLHAIPAPEGWGPDEPEAWPLVTSGPSVVHLDLHPANVILTENHGPALVDWANARTGTAELDVSLTALIISEVAVDAGGVYSQAARALLAAFLAASDIDPLVELDVAAELRAPDPVAGARRARAGPCGRRAGPGPGRGRRAPLTSGHDDGRPGQRGGRRPRVGQRALNVRQSASSWPAPTRMDSAVHSSDVLCTHSARWQAPTWVITLSRPPLVPSGKNVVHCASPVVPPMFTAAAWQCEWSLYEQPATEHSATAGMSIRVLMSTSVGAGCALLSTVDPSHAPCIGRKARLTRRSGPQFR